MRYEKDDYQIFTVEEVPRVNGDGVHIVRSHFCMYKQLQALYVDGVVTITLNEPFIDGTDWSGSVIKENVTVDIYLDGEKIGQVELTDGQGEFELTGDPGRYELVLQAPMCQLYKMVVTL